MPITSDIDFATIEAAAPEADRSGQPQPRSLDVIRASGLLGLTIPTCYGGLGEDALQCNRQITKLARHDASQAIVVFQHLAVVARILEHGTRAQQDLYLPRMASGELFAASAWSERGSGANKQRLATTAVVDPGGCMRINGAKTFTTSAAQAGIYLVLVKSGEEDSLSAKYGAGGQSFVLIEADRPGVVPKTDLDLIGMRSSSTGFVDFVDCCIPVFNVLGPLHGATEVIAGARRSGMTLGAVAVGIAEAALQLAVAAVRKIPTDIAHRPVAAYRLATMVTEVRAARALVEQAGRRDPDTVGTDTLAAKVFASETSERVCRAAQQILGGSGFIRGTTIDRLARDARAVALMGPVNDRDHLTAHHL